MTTILTLGTFDLFHRGHVELLRRARNLGDRLVVGLNTDEFVAHYKSRAPVMGYEDRLAVVLACRYVDLVLPNEQRHGTAWPLIRDVAPAVIAVGTDWADRDYLGQLGIEQRDLDEIGTRVQFLPYTDGISSTQIRAKLTDDGLIGELCDRVNAQIEAMA